MEPFYSSIDLRFWNGGDTKTPSQPDDLPYKEYSTTSAASKAARRSQRSRFAVRAPSQTHLGL